MKLMCLGKPEKREKLAKMGINPVKAGSSTRFLDIIDIHDQDTVRDSEA
jgi:hypothetical protein